MARTNIVTAAFAEGRSAAKTAPIWQHDYGMILVITGISLPVSFQAQFSNKPAGGTTTTMIGESEGGVANVDIPNALLDSGENIYVFIYLHQGEDDGETAYTITIPVNDRSEPDDVEPTPEQANVIDQAIAALQAAVAMTQASEEAADASAEDAEAWAVGQRDGVPVEEDDETYNNNSKFYADVAGQAAASAGYMYMNINSVGHLIYTKTENVDVDFELDGDGHLIVELEEGA